MKADPQKYHRRSIRLRDYDYSSPGGYFLTIVARQRGSLFGEISQGHMRLNEAGRIVQTVWQRLPERYPGMVLDECVVMPDHFHAIVFIEDVTPVVGTIHIVPGGDELSPRPEDESPEEYRLRRRRMLIPKIVGYFKMNSAKAINNLLASQGVPVWQRNYYERVIRNEKELGKIRQYIFNNPIHWDEDEKNPAITP